MLKTALLCWADAMFLAMVDRSVRYTARFFWSRFRQIAQRILRKVTILLRRWVCPRGRMRAARTVFSLCNCPPAVRTFWKVATASIGAG